jgi:DNA repair protein RecO (recombination protein O)
MEQTFKTEGVILARTNFGEADRIITIFTKRFGKLRLRAPGIRRVTSKKAPHLELFGQSQIFFVQGKTLGILTEAETINKFVQIRKDLKKIAAAYFLCELVDRLCPERQENGQVYTLTCQSLAQLESIDPARTGIWCQDFAHKLLFSLGYLPQEERLTPFKLEDYLENIIQRKLKSPYLLRKIN